VYNPYDDEEWASIHGYPSYEISNYGRVFNVQYQRFLKPRFDSDGYARVTLRNSNRSSDKKIHRLVASEFLPDRPEAVQVNHDDGDKGYNYVENLEWMTPTENQNHAFRTGLNKSGRKRAVRIVETGEVFDSLTFCALAINASPGNIAHCLSGKSKTCSGFTFEYVDREVA
jgi:hypothetical protein